MVKFLLEQGANKNHRNQGGQTAADLAKKRGHTKVLELLR